MGRRVDLRRLNRALLGEIERLVDGIDGGTTSSIACPGSAFGRSKWNVSPVGSEALGRISTHSSTYNPSTGFDASHGAGSAAV